MKILTLALVSLYSLNALAAPDNSAINAALARQVLQNQIYLESYQLEQKIKNNPELRQQAEQNYETTVGIRSTAGSVGIASTGSLVMVLLRSDELMLTGSSGAITGIVYSMTSSVGAAYGLGVASFGLPKSTPTQNSAALASSHTALKHAVDSHCEVVADFFALSPSETAKFKSALLDEAVRAISLNEKNVDSVEVLLKLNLIEPGAARVINSWRKQAAAAANAGPTLSKEKVIYAELNQLVWTSAVMKAYLASPEGLRMSPAAQMRLRRVVNNSDAMLQRASLAVDNR